MNDATPYYKVLNDDGTAYHGGTGRWHLPTAEKPGRWMRRIPRREMARIRLVGLQKARTPKER